jgi:hypothetical protein
MLENGKATLVANRLEITTDAIDMTTCDDNEQLFEQIDSRHTLTIMVRVHV